MLRAWISPRQSTSPAQVRFKGVTKTTARRGANSSAGGKTAWKVIKAGLAEQQSEPEYKQALTALKTYRGSHAVKWALKNVNEENEVGELAREFLIGMTKSKSRKKIIKSLRKTYTSAKSNDDFDQRVRLAWLLAEFGQIERVKSTLLAAFSPDYVANKRIKSRVRRRAWAGLRFYRDPSVFSHTVSRRRKLKMFRLFIRSR